MPDTTTPATGVQSRTLAEIRELALTLEAGWEQELRILRASGVPLNAADGGDGGDTGAGDGSGRPDDDGAADGSGDGAGEPLGDAGKQALAAERKARRDAEKRARDFEEKVNEFQQRDMTEQQKLEQRAADAEGKLPTLEQENARLRVALDKGLTGDKAILIDRLRGTTTEELMADADELLKHFGGGGQQQRGSGFDGGPRGDAPASDMDTLIRQQAGFA